MTDHPYIYIPLYKKILNEIIFFNEQQICCRLKILGMVLCTDPHG